MSTSVIIGLIGMAVFLVLMFIGVPVGFSMLGMAFIGNLFLMRTPSGAFSVLSDSFIGTFTNYTTCVAPMFMLMGEIASESGLGASLFDAAHKVIGHKRGGLASAVQCACALFGAICGSAAATAAMMGRVAYPQMKKYGYDDRLSTGCIASGASLSVLIPPSLPLIIYGIATEESIGKLFVAGITVGLVLMIVFIATITIWVALDPKIAPVAERAKFLEMVKAVKNGGFIELILVFALAMGGLFAGWFTPTEAGAVGVAGILIVCIIFKRFSFGVLKRAINNTVTMTAMIYVLIASATAFGKFFTLSRIPSAFGSWIAGMDVSKYIVLLAITLIYFVLGALMDEVPMLLLTLPIFYPVVTGVLGYDGIWFGAYCVIVMGLGAVLPPVGMSCFIVAGVLKDKVALETIFRGIWPFVISFLVMIALLAVFPAIADWLPSVVYG